MSWLYTLVIAGLLFSSDKTPARYSCDLNSNKDAVLKTDDSDRFEQTYPLAAGGRVSLNNVNGDVVVNAWDRNEVKVVAVKSADNKEALDRVQIKVDAKPDFVKIETDYGHWPNSTKGGDHLKVQYELSVPRDAVLNEIETVNGNVTLADLTNFIKSSSVNGNIRASNLSGTADLSAVNGDVVAEFSQLAPGAKINLDIVNGTARVSLPSDANATVKADSLNGSITNDFGLPVHKGQFIGRDLYGRLGTGETKVKLSSVNGELAINRNKDGRSPAPATNLLNQKGNDDDWNDDKDTNKSMSNMNRSINKTIAKSMADSQKQVAVAMKEAQEGMRQAQQEMKNVKVEIPEIKVDGVVIQKAIDQAEMQKTINESIRQGMRSMRDINFSGMPRIEKKSSSIPVKPGSKVTVTAPGCSVRVRGWDKSEVQYNIVHFSADAQKEVGVTEDHNDTGVNIVVNGKGVSPDEDDERILVEVYVPRHTDLTIRTDGQIRLDGVSGNLDVTGGVGSIDVRDSDGKMKVAAASGQVRVIGFRGDLDAKSDEGDVFLEGDFNSLVTHVTDGTLTLTLSPKADATIATDTDDIKIEGLPLSSPDKKTWRLGEGTHKYDLSFGDGTLIVRSAADIASL